MKYFISSLFLLYCLMATDVYAATQTLTTYYPAPQGNYKNMTVNNIFTLVSPVPGADCGASSGYVLVNNTGVLELCQSSGGRVMDIDTNGNVGIGEATTPLGKLQVLGNGYFDQGGNTYVTVGPDVAEAPNPRTEAGMWYDSANAALRIEALSGGIAWRNIVLQGQGNGSVGIGVTNPGALLQVGTNLGGANTNGFYDYNSPNSGYTLLRARTEWTDGNGGNLVSIENNTGTAMVIDHSRNVGIGMTPGSYMLDVNGNIEAVGFFYNTSDRRLKKDIVPITGALDKVQRINGVSFRWKKDNVQSIGVIAQDVEKVVPELVSTGKNGIKSVAYGNLTALLIEAIKEQQKQIEELKRRICAQKYGQ